MAAPFYWMIMSNKITPYNQVKWIKTSKPSSDWLKLRSKKPVDKKIIKTNKGS